MKQGVVEKIINGGWGLVRSDEGVVFLNYVLPGELVSYVIKEKANGILWGETREILSTSPHRVDPPCPYYGECGGCIFQHIDYSFQKEIKREILENDLSRIGHVSSTEVPVTDVIGSPPYNNRIRARMKAQPDGKIGFIRKGTNDVISINRCLLFPEAVNAFLLQWNSLPNPPFFHQMDILVNRDSGKVFINLSRSPKEEKGEKSILKLFPDITFCWKGNEDAGVSRLNVKDWSYLISPSVFFQVNPFQWENMLDTVESHLHQCHTIIDLYSGVGFFIPLLRKYAGSVIGVENSPFSVTLGKRAFQSEGAGIAFVKVAAENYSFPHSDMILVDPPRSGLDKKVINGILRNRYKRVIYISCSTATFSRDLNILRSNGYRVDSLKAFDLFPQTSHLESIGLFCLDT